MIKDPELLKLAVKAIEAEPERWDQRLWNATDQSFPEGNGETVSARLRGCRIDVEFQDMEHCGTTMCLAGHVVLAAGMRPLAGAWGNGNCLDPETNEIYTISLKAADLLGLTEKQKDDLFYTGYHDTLPEFKQRITTVTGVEFE